MARLSQAGCETRSLATSSSQSLPDGFGGSGTVAPTVDTLVFRSGTASWKCTTTASAGSTSFTDYSSTFVDGRTYYMRAYVNGTSTPGGSTIIMCFGSSEINVRLLSNGTIDLNHLGGGTDGSPSVSVITDGVWHRIELKAVATATGLWTASELFLDGSLIASVSGLSVSRTVSSVRFGWVNWPGGAVSINFDDFALNDSTGSVNNGYPGDGKVVLLKPTSDSAVGLGWTDDNAATTGLFNSVNKTPPTGIADTTTGGGGHQIRNATSNANVNYDANMTTYTNAGIGASDVIKAIIPWVCTAAPVATSAKLGNVGVVSNPAITLVALGAAGTAGAFWQGNAASTFPTGWKGSPGTVTENPSVTLGTAPVMRIQQVTASTRIAMVCFMGMYVDYTPGVTAKSLIAAPMSRQQLRQLTRWY